MTNSNDLMTQIRNKLAQKNEISSQAEQFEQKVIAEKLFILKPIQELLQEMVNNQILVHHNHYYELKNKEAQNVKFSFSTSKSCPECAPGMSLVFDHPAMVEIAVHNNRATNGMIRIYVGSPHPEGYMLNRTFKTVDLAVKSLTKFLVESVQGIA